MLECSASLEPRVGRRAPNFSLEASGGQHVSLEQYRGRWLVLFFYPRDFTFVCPTEILGFSHRMDAFDVRKADILGISTDSVYVHEAWMRTSPAEGGIGELGFPLAGDVTHEVSRSYGVYDERQGLALRGLFIIDPEGTVQYQVVHNLSVGRSVDEVLRVLDALQSGGLCPLNWQCGEPLLTPA